MRAIKYLLLLVIGLGAVGPASAAERYPHIGYVYPAGGQKGTTFEVTVGGQFLRGATDIYVSGEGVRGEVVKHYALRMNLNGEQRRELLRRLAGLRQKRVAELAQKGQAVQVPRFLLARGNNRPSDSAEDGEPVELPEHPMLRGLEDMDLRQLQHLHDQFLDRQFTSRRQPNSQLSEVVLVEVSVDPDAPAGDRELRLGTRLGLTNPMPFQVGTLPEVEEREPNDPEQSLYLPPDPPLEPPVLVNGQMLPGDVDRLLFRARAGQRLVIEAAARRLVPFLADAVPGWFQATLTLYDAAGRQVAYADDWRFDPDPVLLFKVPGTGEYELEIRDAIYRGREDFVYRISIAENPFVTAVFPLGGRAGGEAAAAVEGWNLGNRRLPLDTRPGLPSVRRTALQHNGHLPNEIVYAVDTLPETVETEPNDGKESAERISLPIIVNGRIGRPGDVDVFEFEGRAADKVAVEVVARRLHSPLDSLVRVTDPSGQVVASNDDYVRKEGHLHTDMGILTHHADSYLTARLASDGACRVQVTDARGHGGAAYAYRLRISRPRPDFTLRVSPSCVSLRPGAVAPITVHVLRKDGFAGEIEVMPVDASSGFSLEGGRVPAGRDRVHMTLRARWNAEEGLFPLELEGRARINGETVRRPATPCEDVMQAFLWRHLVPTEEFLVNVNRRMWRTFPAGLEGRPPVRVPSAGATQVRLGVPRNPRIRRIFLKPVEAPEGISVSNVELGEGELSFELRADSDAPPVGYANNILLGVTAEIAVPNRGQSPDDPEVQVRRNELGVLPAIPYVITDPDNPPG